MVCVQEYLYTNRKNYSLSSITLFFSFLSFLYFIIPLLLYLSHLLNTTFNVSFFLYLAYFKFQSLSPLLFNFFFSIFACFSPLPVHYCHYFSVTNYLTHPSSNPFSNPHTRRHRHVHTCHLLICNSNVLFPE